MYLLVAQGLLITLDISAIYMWPLVSFITRSFVFGGVYFDKTSENTEYWKSLNYKLCMHTKAKQK